MNSDHNKKYYLISSSEGCTTNLSENSTYKNHLATTGHIRCQRPEDADFIIVNTCGYSLKMEQQSLKIINALKKKHPEKKIIIGGCLPGINPMLFKDQNNHGPTFMPGDLEKLSQILGMETTNHSTISNSNSFDLADTTHFTLSHRLVLFLRPLYFKIENLIGRKFQPLHNIIKSAMVNNDFFLITAAKGCLGKCTYCGIRKAKGKIKSKHLNDIKKEFVNGLEQGHRNFWLLGDDLGPWGYDIGLTSVDLLREIISIDQDYELAITFFEPEWFSKLFEKLEPIFSDKRIININFPIQSGSSRLVKRMGRNYEIDDITNKIEIIKKQNTGLAIKTNIMIGFPGETWNDFLKTVMAMRYFDAIVVNKYTPRPGTPAANYNHQITEIVKQIRMIIMNMVVGIRHFVVAAGSLLHFNLYRNIK